MLVPTAPAETPSPGNSFAPYWTEPGTRRPYPTAYRAYRRAREEEEKRPARHRSLGPEVDRYVWRRWRDRPGPEVDVRLTFRPDTPPRIRRMVSEILRAIGHGHAAGEAIRHVSRRFGLRHTRTRAFISDCIGFEVRPRDDGFSAFSAAPWSPNSPLADSL